MKKQKNTLLLIFAGLVITFYQPMFAQEADVVLSDPLTKDTETYATNSVLLAPGFNSNGFLFQANIVTILPVNIPVNLISSDINNSGIKLSWTDNSESETGFVIERSKNTNTNFQPVGTVAADNPVFFDYKIENSTQYYYRVKAFNAFAVSEPSDEITIIAPAGLGTTKYNTATQMNSVLLTMFDESENVVAQSINYANSLGKPTQSISRNVTEGNVTATMTLYDSYGRGVVSTLPAVVDQQHLDYIEGFVTNSNGTTEDDLYNYNNFDYDKLNNPDEVNSNSPLGYYYSDDNSFEAYVPATGYPYTRVEYSIIQPGAARRSTLASKEHRMGQGNEIESYSMQVPDDELYDFGTTTFDITDLDTKLDYKSLVKTITIDPEERINVTYTNADGAVVASCLGSGGTAYQVSHQLDIGEYVDIHIPVGCENSLVLDFGSMEVYDIYNLSNDDLIEYNIGDQVDISSGFYRVRLVRATKVAGETSDISYNINYKEHSFNFYDKTGKLKYSLSPKGYQDWLNSSGTLDEFRKLTSEYHYNSLGWLLYTSQPDIDQNLGVEARFTYYTYRKDGVIRFSQNPQQSTDGVFSYTNYDDLGRIIESGECDEGATSGLTYLTSSGLLEEIYDQGYFNTGVLEGREYGPNYETTPPSYCHDQTYFFYDEPAFDWDIEGYSQNFTIGAVSKTWNDNSTTWYSYTYDGKIEWVAKQLYGLDKNNGTIDEINITEYFYDFNGNVTEVKNTMLVEDETDHSFTAEDEFIHEYIYDADKRLDAVYTTDNNQNTKLQAHYSYYNHGPLKRTELGGNLQGIDYVYTTNGWLKSINHPSLEVTNDPGKDGDVSNQDFKPDVFGLTLDYYYVDYRRTGSNVQTSVTTEFNYGGNISAVRWNTRGLNDAKQTLADGFHWGYILDYDEHNWLTEAHFRSSDGLTWSASGTEWAYSLKSVSYDLNGNIKSVNRNGLSELTNLQMDDLTYHYYGNTNKLEYIDDADGASKFGSDIGDQDAGNYVYNSIGQLVSNTADGQYFEYDVYGKVTAIYSDAAKTTPKVYYYYDENGYRIAKENVENGKTTWYVRDNSGNILSIYTDDNDSGNILPEEFPIYAASRIGTAFTDGAGNTSYVYEITDHLGNVRATLGDDYFTSNELLSYADYYPMGMVIPGREKVASHEYRFGYQGQHAEKDDETGYNQFEARLYDSRIGRWMVFDPAGQYYSPYLGMGNSWVSGIDPNGESWFDHIDYNTKTKKTTVIEAAGDDHLYINGNYIGDAADGTGLSWLKSHVNEFDVSWFDDAYYKTWDTRFQNRFEGLTEEMKQRTVMFINYVEATRGIRLRIGADGGFRTNPKQEEFYWNNRILMSTPAGYGPEGAQPVLLKITNKKWKTNARGGESFHNYGLAVDLYDVGSGKTLSPSQSIGRIGDSFGFYWGGHFKDKPHFQLGRKLPK